jgi:hypothetical protein
MASRALIDYSNGSGGYINLTIEHSSSPGAGVFDESTIEQWALDNTPDNFNLVNVRYSPEYEQIFP